MKFCEKIMKFDVICFGSATIDSFLVSKEFRVKKTPEGMMMCEGYGKKINLDNYEITTGGGATNTAVCFERLGMQSAIIACVGDDYWGRIIKAKLSEDGASLLYLQTTDKHPTSMAAVLVSDDGGRTVLVYRSASNFISPKRIEWERLNASWVYVSSLGGNLSLLHKIIRFAKRRKLRVALNPGKDELGSTKLRIYLSMIDVLILNRQEIFALIGDHDMEKLKIEHVLSLKAGLVLVTEGRRGAYAYAKNGKVYFQPPIKTRTIEETGAGDAFGSSFVAGQIYGLSIEQSLRLAAINAASVVSQIGPKKGLLFWPDIKRQL